MSTQPKYTANKISGVPSTLYAISVILELIHLVNTKHRYHFPFYGLTTDISKRQADEWIDEKGYKQVSDVILQDVMKEGFEYFHEVHVGILKEAHIFRNKTKEIVESLSDLSINELDQEYKSFIGEYVPRYALGGVTFLYEGFLSERLTGSLFDKYENVAEIIGALVHTEYTSFMVKSERFLERIRDEGDRSKKSALAQQYLKQFYFIKTSYISAPVVTVQDVLKDTGGSHNKKEEQGQKGDKIQETLDLTDEEQAIVDLLKVTEAIRDQRKLVNLIGSYGMFRFLDEVVKRNGIPAKLASNIFWNEYHDLLMNPKDVMKRLEKRTHTTCVYDGEKTYQYLEGIHIASADRVEEGVREITGTPASKGSAKGTVRIVLGLDDFQKLNDGDILIAQSTRPDFVPIMKKAAAIVTDEGGLVSHAAIVSRELKTPCIVGTKIVTQALKDGDEVEVDANAGVVKILKKAG